MKTKLKFESAIEKWCDWILFICLLLLSLGPLAMAIVFAIVFSPWCLFILATYFFFGPVFILGIHDCWDLLRNF